MGGTLLVLQKPFEGVFPGFTFHRFSVEVCHGFRDMFVGLYLCWLAFLILLPFADVKGMEEIGAGWFGDGFVQQKWRKHRTVL